MLQTTKKICQWGEKINLIQRQNMFIFLTPLTDFLFVLNNKIVFNLMLIVFFPENKTLHPKSFFMIEFKLN